jgi:DnaJ-class molecular chaperone
MSAVELNMPLDKIRCRRCKGAGSIEKIDWSDGWIYNVKCYDCNGKGVIILEDLELESTET